MGKKVKIGNKWVSVDDEDVKDDPETVSDDVTDEDNDDVTDEGSDNDASTDDDDSEEKSFKDEARAIGKNIADSVIKNLNDNDVASLKKTVERLVETQMPKDAKLNKILSGKDYIRDAQTLTKEEKIVGFFHALISNNEVALRALSEGTDADGGFLFPNEFLNEMVRELPNINVMRNYVRIIPMRRDVMNITNLVSGPQVTWTAENATKSTTTARFSQLTLTAFKVASILYTSDELIDDSDIFDVVQMIIGLFAEAIADEEERVIWVGNGTTQPTGIDQDGNIPTVASVNQDFDDLINVHYNLPRKYRQNANWFMNDSTMSNVRKLKDSNNNYIVQTGVAGANQVSSGETILGKGIVISDWVPDNTIFFGDMRRTYYMGDRQRMTVKISQDTTQAFTQDMTAIRVVSRIGGIVAQPLACRELTGF